MINVANKITIVRLLLVPFFISFVLYSKWEMALAIFVLAAISDGLDGFIARRFKQRTELGTVLDPIADKILILSAFISLSVVKTFPGFVKLPLYVPIVIISRDAIIVLGTVLAHFIKGKIEISPTRLGKVTTFFQMITVISILMKLHISPLLWNIAVAFTIISGTDYIIKGARVFNEK